MEDDYEDTPLTSKEPRSFATREELLAKLEGKVALHERICRDNKDLADDFEIAAQAVRDGAVSVTVGRTTYKLDSYQ